MLPPFTGQTNMTQRIAAGTAISDALLAALGQMPPDADKEIQASVGKLRMQLVRARALYAGAGQAAAADNRVLLARLSQQIPEEERKTTFLARQVGLPACSAWEA